MCVLLIFTISINTICVSQEKLSLVESYQQIYDFNKSIILKSKGIVTLCKVNFCINKLFIQCNTAICCVHTTGGVKIYLCLCVSLLVCVFCVFVSVCVNQIRVLAKTMSSVSSVNLKCCCISHTAKCC